MTTIKLMLGAIVVFQLILTGMVMGLSRDVETNRIGIEYVLASCDLAQ